MGEQSTVSGGPPGPYSVPNIQVVGRGIEAAVDHVLNLWKAEYPQNYAAWSKECELQRQLNQDSQGWSASGEVKLVCIIPDFVDLMMGRFFGTQDWKREIPGALDTVNSVMECNRLGLGKAGSCSAKGNR